MVAEAKKRQAALAAYEKTLPARMVSWEGSFSRKPAWQPLEIVTATSQNKATLTKQPDNSILVGGANPATDVYTITGKALVQGITGIRLEVLADKSLKAMGPGRAPNGNFVLNELKLSAIEEGQNGKPAAFALQKAQATFSQASFEIAKAIDNNPATGWAISPQMGKAQEALFELQKPIAFAKGAVLTVKLQQTFGQSHTIGRFRLSFTTSKPPLSLVGPPAHLAALFAIEPANRTPEQKAALTAAYRGQDAELARLQREVASHAMPVDRRHPGAQDLVWALINSKSFQFNH